MVGAWRGIYSGRRIRVVNSSKVELGTLGIRFRAVINKVVTRVILIV